MNYSPSVLKKYYSTNLYYKKIIEYSTNILISTINQEQLESCDKYHVLMFDAYNELNQDNRPKLHQIAENYCRWINKSMSLNNKESTIKNRINAFRSITLLRLLP